MLNIQRQLNILIGGLLLIGTAIFIYKWLYLHIPLKPPIEEAKWMLEAKFTYHAKNYKTKLQLAIPDQQPNFLITNENFISANYGLLTKHLGLNRYAIWTTSHARGKQILYYRLIVQPRATPSKITYRQIKNSSSEKRQTFNEAEQAAIKAILEEAKSKSSDNSSLVSHVINILNQSTNQNSSLLLGNDHSNQHIVLVATQTLSQIGMEAYLLQGMLLETAKDTTFIPWLAVRHGKEWNYFDPQSGEEYLPPDFLIWHIGSAPLYQIEGGQSTTLKIAKLKQYFAANTPILENSSILLDFSLNTLPVQAQTMYKILLTMPLGAFIILIFRNYVGIPTFGTFMPVLIALAFLEIRLFWGITLFVTIVAFGLAVRFYLERLHLLLVPRLSAVLVTVVMFIAFIGIIMNKLGLQQGTSAALFPLVILTMTIERMCNLWDERGALEATKTGVGSLSIASLAYLTMRQETIQYVLFNFAELNLVLLAVILLLGQYRGYRLTELKRFQSLSH